LIAIDQNCTLTPVFVDPWKEGCVGYSASWATRGRISLTRQQTEEIPARVSSPQI